MALRRIPLSDLLSVTVRQPLLDQVPPPGHCFISFRAGLMPRVDGKLTSDKRKGQLAVVKNEDGLIALQWFEREAKEDGSLKLAEEPELDQIVFEFDGQFDWAKREKRLLKMSFKEVRPFGLGAVLAPAQTQGPHTLTVAKTSQDPARNLFFWLQEPDTMWDDDLVMRLNKAIVGNHWKPAAAAPMAAPASTANPTTPAAAQAPAPAQASTSTGAGNLLNFDALLACVPHATQSG